MKGVEYGMAFFLLVDVLISPLKAFYDEGILIKDRQTIVKRYIKLELWIDLSAIIAIIIPLIL